MTLRLLNEEPVRLEFGTGTDCNEVLRVPFWKHDRVIRCGFFLASDMGHFARNAKNLSFR